MAQGKYVELSVAQRSDVWRRWKAGESLHTIGRAFDRPHTSVHCLLAHHGGIIPVPRRRGLLTLTLTEREEISRGMASGSSIRDIAKSLERAASTVSREVARHGGRPEYRAQEADQRAWASRPKRCNVREKLWAFRLLRVNCAQVLRQPFEPARLTGYGHDAFQLSSVIELVM